MRQKHKRQPTKFHSTVLEYGRALKNPVIAGNRLRALSVGGIPDGDGKILAACRRMDGGFADADSLACKNRLGDESGKQDGRDGGDRAHENLVRLERTGFNLRRDMFFASLIVLKVVPKRDLVHELAI